MDDEDQFRCIKDFPGYRVGSDGSIWSTRKRGINKKPWTKLNPSRDKDGYRVVSLCRGSGVFIRKVAYLVLVAFVGPKPHGMEASHYPDNDRSNNRVENLRWATHLENIRHKKPSRKQTHGASKLTPGEVIKIRRMHAFGNYNYGQLALIFGVGPGAIRLIILRKSWKGVR